MLSCATNNRYRRLIVNQYIMLKISHFLVSQWQYSSLRVIKKLFRAFLNSTVSSTSWTVLGNRFHIFGPTRKKALPPYLLEVFTSLVFKSKHRIAALREIYDLLNHEAFCQWNGFSWANQAMEKSSNHKFRCGVMSREDLTYNISK